jgi:hypothetical protein
MQVGIRRDIAVPVNPQSGARIFDSAWIRAVYCRTVNACIAQMHFRIRQNVVQLVRTNYDQKTKKPKAAVVGRMRLEKPELTRELRAQLTDREAKEAEAWIENHGRLGLLREEFAALTLAETLRLATNWFSRNADSRAAAAAVASVLPALHQLRKLFKEGGLL